MKRSNIAKKEGVEGWNWPEFINEKDRIKAYSLRYAHLSPEEALMGRPYENPKIIEPRELRIGDRFMARIKSYDKGGVVFEDAPTKQDLICKTNLLHYEGFKNGNRRDEVELVVIDESKRGLTVDMFQPMFDRWINPIIKDPTIQYVVKGPKTVEVEDLKLMKNGFLGKVSVPVLEEFLGEKFYIEAFIPGSHIVLNIENKFENWIGKTVEAFVVNYIPKPGELSHMSLICSRKNLLTFQGNLSLIDLYNIYCDGDENWKNFEKNTYMGKVTGVINSSKKCGVFVEIPSLLVTGMVMMEPEKIVKYKPMDEVMVSISGFEDMSYVDSDGFRYHNTPYEILDGRLKSCILKPVLKLS